MKSRLTFELSKNADEIFIFADSEGLRSLAAKLNRLADKVDAGNPDHEHLMTQEWAGNELSSVAQGADTSLVNHVKIYAKPKC
jgi:hypothetical protein